MESVRNAVEILKRELKSYFESPVAYVFLVVFLALIGFCTFFVHRYYEWGQAEMKYFFFWHPWVYLLLVPAVAMRLWSEERRSGTIELLLTLPVSLSQAILGKFLAGWLFLCLALSLTFPIVLTTALLGGDLDGGVVVCGYLGSASLAGAYLSVGMFASATTRNQVISFVVSVVICLLLVLSGYPPVTDMFVKWAPTWLVNSVTAVSVLPHFDSMQGGVVDIRDLGYFAGVIVIMLAGTHMVLSSRKAN